jgi:hypothetical protein
VGEAGRARSVLGVHPIQVTAPNVRKNAAHKESSQEKSHVQRQGLMTGMSRLADLGKMVQEEREFGPVMAFYRQGRVRGWHRHNGP